MESTGLTKREFQIMNVLWNSSEPLSAHDVSVAAPELSRNTIQIVLKKLQEIGFVEVAGFTYHKNALTRTFTPAISQTEYTEKSLSKTAAYQIARNFIQSSAHADELRDLKNLICQRSQELEAEK